MISKQRFLVFGFVKQTELNIGNVTKRNRIQDEEKKHSTDLATRIRFEQRNIIIAAAGRLTNRRKIERIHHMSRVKYTSRIGGIYQCVCVY